MSDHKSVDFLYHSLSRKPGVTVGKRQRPAKPCGICQVVIEAPEHNQSTCARRECKLEWIRRRERRKKARAKA